MLSILETVVAVAVITILLANFFRIDLKAKYESPETQSAISQSRGFISNIWYTYLKDPVTYLWDAFLDNMQRIHDGEPTDLQLYAPKAPFTPGAEPQ